MQVRPPAALGRRRRSHARERAVQALGCTGHDLTRSALHTGCCALSRRTPAATAHAWGLGFRVRLASALRARPARAARQCHGCCRPSWALASRLCRSTWGRHTATLGARGCTAAERARCAVSARRCAAPRLKRLAGQDSPPVDVSVFKITGASASDPKLVAARNGVKRLRTVRARASAH